MVRLSREPGTVRADSRRGDIVHPKNVTVAEHGVIAGHRSFPRGVMNQRDVPLFRMLQSQRCLAGQPFRQGIVNHELSARTDVDRLRCRERSGCQ